MEFLNHGPLKGEKLQFMARVVGFSHCQAPTGIDNDGISSVIMTMVEDWPQAKPTSVGVEFKRPLKISVGKNKCHGAQTHHIIEQLLTPAI